MTDQQALWRPGADMQLLQLRGRLMRLIRAFFANRGVLEVETPCLSSAASPAPELHSFRTHYHAPGSATAHPLYLHTSPEFAMKRLLAAGSGPIYQICKVFRDAERGRYHNPEFTLLEWYRPGFDHHQLMDEIEALFAAVLPARAGAGRAQRLTYCAAFEHHAGLVGADSADPADIRACAERHALTPVVGLDSRDRDGWLDLLMGAVVAPRLGRQGPTFIYDYPESQAALARVRPGTPAAAERFELFVNGVELANGFHELDDAAEQRRRFQAELDARHARGLPAVPVDEHLLAALEAGLPDCAGVALGVDRLVMLAAGAGSLDEVVSFTLERA